MLPAVSKARMLIRLAPILSLGTVQENEPELMFTGELLQVTTVGPERESEMVPVTFVTGTTMDEPSSGDVIVSIGKVLSRLTTTLAVAVSPAVSVTVPLMICPEPSVETT